MLFTYHPAKYIILNEGYIQTDYRKKRIQKPDTTFEYLINEAEFTNNIDIGIGSHRDNYWMLQ